VSTSENTLSKPEARWSWAFVLAVPFGVLLLWITGLIGALFAGWGDCFSPEDVCRAQWETQKVHRDVVLVVVAGLTVLGVLAVAFGRRRMPGLLLAGTVATFVLAFVPVLIGIRLGWWVPSGLVFTTPALAILALASGGQIRWWTQAEQQRHNSQPHAPQPT
jgi:hypothetical protein